ncbi:MAG: S41 family peptidase [Spirochaetales bacterium]|nr:S41 family peptidase [Spirochaetales bacterium]MCF7938694.1 S41 family peptidase [Spirochaetales bacterium]
MEEKPHSSKNRFLWAGSSVAALALILFLALTPALFSQAGFTQSEESDTESQRLLTLFQQVYYFVKNNYVDEVEASTLIEGALTGMFESLDDPHSAYLTKEEMRDLQDTTTGRFGGVGLYISKQNPDLSDEAEEEGYYRPYVEVVSPIEGTPAYRAGVHAGDYITAINGESTEDLNIDEVVKRLRGAPGSTVTVTILRGEDLVFDVELERAMVEVPTERHAMIPGGIGYIRIIQFTPYTRERVRDALEDFQKKSYDSLIIDLRQNPGGLLTSVVDTADLFFSGGEIVSTKSRVSKPESFTANPGSFVPSSFPIIVLIDKGSASASEILAGAMKDRDRALLIGETSYGKGSVQQVRSIGQGGFRLTMSRYYTPSGDTIDKVGVTPDVKIKEPEMTEEDMESYQELISSRAIPKFIDENPDPSQSRIDRFVSSLQKDGIELKERIIRRLIRNEINRTKDDPPVYDLEYDLILQEAVERLQS